MAEFIEPPFSALPARHVEGFQISLINQGDDTFSQRLRMDRLPSGYQVFDDLTQRYLAGFFQNNGLGVKFIKEGEEVLLPEDTMNLGGIDLLPYKTTSQGETFGEKIERLYGELNKQVMIPRQALAISVQDQLVVVLPYKTNG